MHDIASYDELRSLGNGVRLTWPELTFLKGPARILQLLTYRLKTSGYICFIDNNGTNQCHVHFYQCRIKLVNGEYVRFVIMMDYTCKWAYISEITLGSVNFIQHCRTNDMLICVLMADKPCVCWMYPINQCHNVSLCYVRNIHIQKLYAWCGWNVTNTTHAIRMTTAHICTRINS